MRDSMRQMDNSDGPKDDMMEEQAGKTSVSVPLASLERENLEVGDEVKFTVKAIKEDQVELTPMDEEPEEEPGSMDVNDGEKASKMTPEALEKALPTAQR